MMKCPSQIREKLIDLRVASYHKRIESILSVCVQHFILK